MALDKKFYYSTRLNPINIVCHHTASRLVNQIIMQTYATYRELKKHGWAAAARKQLKDRYSISLSEGAIHKYRKALRNGTRPAVCPSVLNGELGSRYGKDGMYKQLDILASIFLDRKDYIGLPANQIIYMSRKYDSVTACEFDLKMRKYMFAMLKYFAPEANVKVWASNINHILMHVEDRKFSIFDLDFMCRITSTKFIDTIVKGINRTAQKTSVICITTSIGRHLTEEGYKKVMPEHLLKCLRSYDWQIKANYSGSYTDRVSPMRYEMVVIQK